MVYRKESLAVHYIRNTIYYAFYTYFQLVIGAFLA
jgi:hypothetical protein